MTNSGNDQEVTKRKTKAQLERERQLEELRVLLSSSGGRYFMWRILSKCRVFDTLSVHDPHTMAIYSGMRDIGLWLLSEIEETDKDFFTSMYKEGKVRDNDR